MDMLAWRVHAAAGETGFSPHRDRQPDNTAASFRADGTPRYATCWLALADATPDTGCLYVIPRSRDPGYSAGVPPTPHTCHVQSIPSLRPSTSRCGCHVHGESAYR